MNKNNQDDLASTRIVNLDFLRGLFIILVLDQHFTYYINMWYVEYFRDAIALSSTYKIHFPMIGQQVSTDSFNIFLGVYLSPWVSQIFLTLAAFNLAKKTQNQFKQELIPKLQKFGLIYIFFLMENFIVAPNMGQAISFYPIMLWMFLMSILAIVYRFTGIRGILFLTLTSFLVWFFPMDIISNSLENLIIENVHPGFEYDARIEYFFSSACLGFLMGYTHYHKPKIEKFKDFYFMLMGSLLITLSFIFGESSVIDPSNALAHEHDLARSFMGILFLIGIQAIVISAFLWLEKKSIRFQFPIISWIGLNSILIFSFHRIFFVRILGPISIMLGSIFGRTIGASSVEVFSYVGITIAVCYFIKNSRIEEIILLKKR